MPNNSSPEVGKVLPTTVDVFNCPYCSEVFIQAEDFIQHLHIHNAGIQIAPPEIHSSESNLEAQQIHGQVADPNLKENDSKNDKTRRTESQAHSQPSFEIGKGNWLCVICNERFSKSYDLQNHMDIHTGDKMFQCPMCNDKFQSVEATESHLREIHEMGEGVSLLQLWESSKTRNAGKTINSNGEDIQSKIQSTSRNQKKKFGKRNPKQVVGHHRSQNYQMKLSALARKEFKSRKCHLHHSRSSAQHVDNNAQTTNAEGQDGLGDSANAGTDQEGPFICPFCSEIFSQSGHLINHLPSHDEAAKLNLDIGEDNPPQNLNMPGNSLSDAGSANYEEKFQLRSCAVNLTRCDNLMLMGSRSDTSTDLTSQKSSTKRKGQLKDKKANINRKRMHHKVATSKKGNGQSKCSICSKLVSGSNIARHMRIHAGVRPHECVRCHKRFSFQWQLKQHMLTHTGEKPFECRNCQKRFSIKSNLKRHMLIHDDGGSRVKCEICKKGFLDSSKLTIHMRIHTGEMPWECTICEHEFAYKSNYKRHMKSLHVKKKSS